MKKYYTKYLPVDGEIKIGEICLVTDDDGSTAFLPFKQVYVDEGGILPKKVELFLCSRDIQIGDHAMELLTTGEYDTFQIDTENDIYDDMIADKRQFKVIGKVSKEALWAKDGDEFDDNEINLQWYDDSGSSDITWTNINEFFDEDDIIDNYIYAGKSYWDYLSGDIKRVQVKGPCGHFH